MNCTSLLALGLITSVLTTNLHAQAIHDWADAPDPSAGVGPMDYITKAPNGPRHKLSPLLYLGPVAGEAEVDGQPNAAATGDDSAGVDDEDAVLSSLVFMEGVAPQVNLSYFNNTGMNATLAVWVDWNQNGDFANDPSEQVSVVVVSKPFQQSQWVNLPAVPAGAANVPSGKVTSFLRVRLATDPAEVEKSFGVAENGEVEDHQILVYDNRDFGDLPDPGPGTGPGNYITSETAGGPYHRVNTTLRLGASVDAELQALPSVGATGDDLNALDDEDGVVFPNLFAGQTAVVVVTATNLNTQVAYVKGYIDWNNNGDFGDAGEMVMATVPAGANNTPVDLQFPVPLNAHAATSVGARFRLSTLATMSSIGGAPDGEVEDYLVQVKQLDFGDLPDVTYFSGPKDYHTLLADDGARHIIVPGLAMSNDTASIDADIDADADGQPNADATGDDNDGNDDDLRLSFVVISQQFYIGPHGEVRGTMEVNFSQAVTNTTGLPATLYLFADADGNGHFTGTGEQASVVIPNGSVKMNVNIPTTFALEEMKPGDNPIHVRFRLTTGGNPGPKGLAMDGEVCDYLVNVNIEAPANYYDLGSLPDPTPGTGSGDYQTSLAHNGAVHWRHPRLRLGTQNGLVIIPPDSSGVTLPPVIHRQQEVWLDVVCECSAGNGLVYVFTDWNNDGDFVDQLENTATVVSQQPGEQTVAVRIQVPPTAILGVPVGMRVRLSNGTLPTWMEFGANAHGGYGEVEDFLITVTQTPAEIAWEAWLDSHGLVGADRDPDADPENDGRSNLEEYATGGVPTPGENPLSIPRLELVEDGGQTRAELVYQERRGAGLGLSYFPHFSPSLQFDPLSVWEEQARMANPPDAPGFDRVRARLGPPVNGLTPRQFARLFVTMDL